MSMKPLNVCVYWASTPIESILKDSNHSVVVTYLQSVLGFQIQSIHFSTIVSKHALKSESPCKISLRSGFRSNH